MDTFQERVARCALAVIGNYGFVLAGGCAVLIHGIVDRPTEDIDLFTNEHDSVRFKAAVSAAISAWESDGLAVEILMSNDTFARRQVSGTDTTVKAELGVDWRANPPSQLDIGAVLDRDDAVANKMCAAFGRGAVRDYIDIDAALSFGYGKQQLIDLATEHDPGFDPVVFAQALSASGRHSDGDFAAYGLSSSTIAELRVTMQEWADEITGG